MERRRDFKNQSGAVLIISSQKNAAESIRSALAPRFGRILCAGSMAEAKNRIYQEKVWLAVVLLPLEKDRGIGGIRELLLNDELCLILQAEPELYYETSYMVQNEKAFVLRNPLRMDLLLQAVQLMNTMSMRIREARREEFRLKKQLQNQLLIHRAKCLLIEERGMSEDEAHHALERMAMNAGIKRTDAARQLIREAEEKKEGGAGPED